MAPSGENGPDISHFTPQIVPSPGREALPFGSLHAVQRNARDMPAQTFACLLLIWTSHDRSRLTKPSESELHAATVRANQTNAVGGDHSETVGKNQTLTVTENQTVTIHKNRIVVVDGSQSTRINGAERRGV